MNYLDTSNELLEFIENSPSMFHSIETIKKYLKTAGFEYLPEGKNGRSQKAENTIPQEIIQA